MTTHTPHIDRTLEINSRTDLLGSVRTFVTRAAAEYGFDGDDVNAIELAVDEAITNIIKHAYKYDPDGVIRVVVSTQENGEGRGRFTVSISDTGISFDTARYHAPDMAEYFRTLRRGGLGIVLMNKLMDEVIYDIHPGSANHLRLVKYRPPSSFRS